MIIINRILIISILISIILISTSCKEKKGYNNNEFLYSDKKILPGHPIPDTNTAVKIAEAIWLANFGKNILRERPYEVRLEMGLDTIWHINGKAYFSDDPKILSFGGVAYLSIRSKDCKILELYHSE